MTQVAQQLGLVVNNDRVVVSSRKVSETFGKRHENLLRDIRGMECPNDFKELNFECVESTEKTAGGAVVKQTEYLLTRDGFTLLVMGFTGKKAMQFKLKYIAAFNEMEQQLRSAGLQQPKTMHEWLASLAEVTQRELQLVRSDIAAIQSSSSLSVQQRGEIWATVTTRYDELGIKLCKFQQWTKRGQFDMTSDYYIQKDLKKKFNPGLPVNQFKWHDLPADQFADILAFVREWKPCAKDQMDLVKFGAMYKHITPSVPSGTTGSLDTMGYYNEDGSLNLMRGKKGADK